MSAHWRPSSDCFKFTRAFITAAPSMLKGLRRCPTSLRWRLIQFPSPITTVRSLQTRNASSKPSHVIAIQTTRSFHQSILPRQSAAAAAQVQEEPEHRALTNEQIDQQGPAKKFVELAERGLISQRIINTITQRMRLDTMTDVQSLTLNAALKHLDV